MMVSEAEQVELHFLQSKTSLDDNDSTATWLLPVQDLSTDSCTSMRETRRHSERWTKAFVLVSACTFSIGSHYSQDCIGPLKDILKGQLDMSDSQISLILGSNLVANTVVPVIAGVLVARFGTLPSSLVATGVLFLGQLINLIALMNRNIPGMIFGLCLFG